MTVNGCFLPAVKVTNYHLVEQGWLLQSP